MKYPFFTLISLIIFACSAFADEFALEKSEKGYKILLDGQLFTEYITNEKGAPIL